MKGSIHNKIKDDITQKKRGSLVYLSDYNPFGTYDAIRQVFSRLNREKLIFRLSPGIYLYPNLSKKGGPQVYPSIDNIIEQIAKKEKAQIIPTGAYTLYKLGFIPEIPQEVTFQSNKTIPPLKVQDGIRLLFTRDFTKYFSLKGENTILVILGLIELGQENITGYHLEKVKELLSLEKKKNLLYDADFAPNWIAEIMISLT